MCLTLSALHDCSFTGLSAWDCPETFRTLMRSAPIPPLLVFSCASAIFRPNPPLASKPCFAKFRVLSDPLVSHEVPPVPYRTTRIHLQTRSGCQARPRHSTHTRHNTRCCLSVPVPPLPGEQVGSTLLSNAPTLLPTRCHPRSSAVSASRVRSQLLRGATPASSTTQAWVCDPIALAFFLAWWWFFVGVGLAVACFRLSRHAAVTAVMKSALRDENLFHVFRENKVIWFEKLVAK